MLLRWKERPRRPEPRSADRCGKSIGRQRKIDRLSLLPRLARRLRADDWSLRYYINGEFPPIAPIGAVEGTDGDSVDSTAGAGLQSHGREVGGIDGDGIRRGVGEDIGAIDQKSVDQPHRQSRSRRTDIP